MKTLLEKLQGKQTDAVEAAIDGHLPSYPESGAEEEIRFSEFRGRLTQLGKEWTLLRLRLQRGVLGPAEAGEDEVVPYLFGELNALTSLNKALFWYGRMDEPFRLRLRSRLVRRIEERIRELKSGRRLSGGAYRQNSRCPVDPVEWALRELSADEKVVAFRARSGDIEAFLRAMGYVKKS